MKKLSTITKILVLTGFSALSLWTAPAQAASFRGLGFLDSSNPYRFSRASRVSADGSSVVGGGTSSNGYEAFLWTQVGGMVGLGFLGGDNFESGASDVSADGSIVVGYSKNANNKYQAFRWTEVEGMVGLGLGVSYSSATGVSADGSIIVGQSNGGSFRWERANGMLNLDFDLSGASDISPDGSVIVGSRNSGNGYTAYSWTQAGGMSDLVGDDFRSGATGVSANGSVVVGYRDLVVGFIHVYGTEAFRWTALSGMVGLGHFNDQTNYFLNSTAHDVSADGYRIVGESDGRAFLWTQETGMVSLKETLIGKGLDLSGWSLTSATAISADGFTIVGSGTHPSGQSEAWVANLSPEPVPEPLTILGSMAAIAFATGFERKFGKNKSEEKDTDA